MTTADTHPARPPRMLVAGIGNIFLGDDAFGLEVVRRLAGRPLPEGTIVADFGIRGFDLACALLEDYDAVIMVDAVPRGGRPGTLYLIEPQPPANDLTALREAGVEMHNLDPVRVLRLAATMGKPVERVLIVGCEPAPLEPDPDEDMRVGLSPAVAAALDEAVGLVETTLEGLVRERLAKMG